jgi:hypothetical protein
MNPEESQQHQDQLRAWARTLADAEHRAAAWRFAAIAIFCIATFCIADLRGCLPDAIGGWAGLGP